MIKVLLGLAFVSGSSWIQAAVLDPETLRAWDEYIAGADQKIKLRLNGQLPFLWTDESAERKRRVLAGETVIAPVIPNGSKIAAQGLIHDWMGAMFIPNTTLQQVLATLHAYDRYKEYFRPFVADSRVCSTGGSKQEFSMIFQYRVVFGNLFIESRYSSKDFVIDEHRRYTIASSVRVQEIDGYGTAQEQRLPPGRGRGFVWALHSISRYEERDGGVYVELEALALSRSIPGALRWFACPLVKRASISGVETALQKMRSAVEARPAVLQTKAVTLTPAVTSRCYCTAANQPGVTPSGSSK
ncbi:MAG TPA: hypothetical protein VKB88_19135 [Bryobacteraceae bacterium]|nr:hypothetical protein [Bryobacteraceae bacterium]